MAKVLIDEEILRSIADSIRKRTGATELIYPGDMSIEIKDGIPLDATQTFILVDEDGNEIPAVLTEEEIPITATPNDIRKGVTAVTGSGVVTGEKVIPSYYTHEGVRAVPVGSGFVIPIVDYDYTKLQAIICPFNKNFDDSVSAEKVVINDNVHNVLSTDIITSVTRDESNSQINLGFINDSSKPYILRYFTYKEIY